MRTLLSTVDYDRYSPRTYVLCHGDTMSLNAIKALEASSKGSVSASTGSNGGYQCRMLMYKLGVLDTATTTGSESRTTPLLDHFHNSNHPPNEYIFHISPTSHQTSPGALGRCSACQWPRNMCDIGIGDLDPKGRPILSQSYHLSTDCCSVLRIVPLQGHLRRVVCQGQIAVLVGKAVEAVCRHICRSMAPGWVGDGSWITF